MRSTTKPTTCSRIAQSIPAFPAERQRHQSGTIIPKGTGELAEMRDFGECR
jgi:hypothetical protein